MGAPKNWQVGRVELEFKRQAKPTLYPQEGYYFKYDSKFRPLRNPPGPGQSKFDQILEWAKQQVDRRNWGIEGLRNWGIEELRD
jgi:hypothetical protein